MDLLISNTRLSKLFKRITVIVQIISFVLLLMIVPFSLSRYFLFNFYTFFLLGLFYLLFTERKLSHSGNRLEYSIYSDFFTFKKKYFTIKLCDVKEIVYVFNSSPTRGTDHIKFRKTNGEIVKTCRFEVNLLEFSKIIQYFKSFDIPIKHKGSSSRLLKGIINSSTNE